MLFVDDCRPAPDGWELARNLAETRAWVTANGAPDVVSLDHDMGDGEPTGLDIARWMLEAMALPRLCMVHSANHWGAESIVNFIEDTGRMAYRTSADKLGYFKKG